LSRRIFVENAAFPAVPTVIEAGGVALADFTMAIWWGLLASAKTDPRILDKLHAALTCSMADPKMRERWMTQGMVPRPMVVFFHGGGFVFGSIDSYYDHVCRVIFSQAECHVMSVAYRLAPENKFPAATEDCWAAVQWAHAQCNSLGADPNRILVAGGSAGANLATVTALRARDESWPALIGQLLFYPLTDFHSPPTLSMLTYEKGYYLTRADVVWSWEQHIASDYDVRNPYAAPLQAKSLNRLPAVIVINAN
jgi:acetyl esterase